MNVFRLTLVLGLLIGVDFACPMLPGAVVFEVEQSVDGSRRLSVPVGHAAGALRRATGPDRVVTLAEPRALAPEPPAGARPGGHAPRGRSSTFLPPESSPSLLEDQ